MALKGCVKGIYDMKALIQIATVTLLLTASALADDPAPVIEKSYREGSPELIEKLREAEELLRRSPDSANLYYYRSNLRLFNGQRELAAADLGVCIRMRPKEPKAYVARGGILQDLGEDDLGKADFEEAVLIYSDKIRRRSTASAALYMERADVFKRLEKFDEALRDLDFAKRISPKDPNVFHARSRLFKEKGDMNHAIAELDEAIETIPNNPYLLTCRGSLYGNKRDFQKAIADFTTGLAIDPPPELARILSLNRGTAWSELGDCDKAIADFNEAIQVDPDAPVVYFHRGHAFYRASRLEEALEDLNKAIGLDPRMALHFIERGKVFSQMNDFHKALADYETAFVLKPKDAAVLDEFARFLVTCSEKKLRDSKRAVELAQKSCERSKWKDDRCIETLSITHAANGDFNEAKKLLQQAINVAPEYRAAERAKIMEKFNAQDSELDETLTLIK